MQFCNHPKTKGSPKQDTQGSGVLVWWCTSAFVGLWEDEMFARQVEVPQLLPPTLTHTPIGLKSRPRTAMPSVRELRR